MRVTLISDEWRRNGGVAAYLRGLASALAARGDEVQVIHGDREGQPVPGVRDHCVPGGTGDSGPAARVAGATAFSHVSDFDPDIVHVQRCNNFVLEAALRARYPAIKTLHDFDFCPSGTKYHHALERPCSHPTGALCLPRMGYKRCTTSRRPQVWLRMQRRAAAANRNNAEYEHLIVASDFMRDTALATGYRPDQLIVVPYFVAEAPAAALHARTILTGGRFAREKGFDLFIDALTRVPRPWRAIVAGDGLERAALERRAREAGLADDIEFAGWQDEDGMRALYARAAVVVMPSRWPEPSGIVGLEAMAHGVPVVAFASGGIPEWLVHGETGLLAPPLDSAALGDAVARILADPDAAARMGRAGRARAQARYTVSGHLARLSALYSSVSRPAA